MVFSKKEKPPLQQAVRKVYDAIETAYKYKRDKNYMPTPEDLKLFDMLEHSLWECHNTAMYISRCMDQRSRGEKEGARKYNNPEIFEYHYPEGR